MEIMDLIRALPGSVAQGLIWGIMAIGVYITYKVLDYADLTVDGHRHRRRCGCGDDAGGSQSLCGVGMCHSGRGVGWSGDRAVSYPVWDSAHPVRDFDTIGIVFREYAYYGGVQ